MSRHLSHLNTAVAIIEAYKGETPLHVYLKDFFAKDKKYGSKDRRTISSLCYYYFRLGHGEVLRRTGERIMLGIYLCEHEPNELLELLKPEWNAKITLPIQEKLHDIDSFYASNIFPWKDELSDGIEAGPFSLSFLIQPKLFIRVRPGHWDTVRQKLTAVNVLFEEVADDCISLDNRMKVEEILRVNVEYVVQDYNSQRVGGFIKDLQLNEPPKVWDCCAASGGKSIMAFDILKNINLTVTDVRPSILQNLQLRFKQAGIKDYITYVADLIEPNKIQTSPFDLVICDAPCSGSGTWGRTPEQLFYFDQEQIEKYSRLQKRIAQNAIPHVKKDCYLFYVTCSVFKSENEAVVKYIQKHSFLKLVKAEILKGYSMKADTMFAAIFKY
jgi:16S rRNA (cytosine967-C5)-methyltransferase